MGNLLNLRKLLICIALLLFACASHAQQRHLDSVIAYEKVNNISDSLISEFENSIYRSIYNPVFWSKCYSSTFTMIKVDIDSNYKITGIRFSDSADSLFVQTYANRKVYHDEYATLEKYARITSNKNISLIIPVIYIPNSNTYKGFSTGKEELLMKFDKKPFVGNAVVRPPIVIKLLPKGNM